MQRDNPIDVLYWTNFKVSETKYSWKIKEILNKIYDNLSKEKDEKNV